MDWLEMFLIVCLILQAIHYSVRINAVERSMKNWAQQVVDECNSELQQAYVGYKAAVSDWLSDFIDTYCYTKETDVTIGNKNNDEKN